ncbi:MAG TPA: hypothetical protein VG272_00520 [Candidatus Acidoferrales bacterium]|nr:hypothetical protein [Candidatus Acidoferrales bacterium]
MRKLFPIYGSSLANNMLATLVHDRIVNGFVTTYVSQYDRKGILGGPARDRELAETIGREIVLALIVEVESLMPSFFGKKQKKKLKADEKQAIDLFLRELRAALERAHNWNSEDRMQFHRDLTMYTDFDVRKELAASVRKKGKAQEEEAPFVARVALLLDPSMLEQARRAARKFHGSMSVLARKLLRQTLSPGRR